MAEQSDNYFDKYETPGAAAPGGNYFDKYDADATAQAAVEANKPGLLESFGRGAVEGATFGFDDKLGLDKERRELSRKANPWAHFMGELAGGAATSMLPLALPAKGVGLAAKAARGVQAVLAPGEISTFGQAAAQGLKLGTVYGGLSGAGHADVKPEDTWTEALAKRGLGTAKGAAQGAVLGPVVGLGAHGIYRGGQNVGNLFARAADETAGAGKGALVTATHKLEQDRIAPQQIIDNILSEFPSASDVAKGGLTRRFWGDIANRQPITREQVEQVVRLAAQNQTPAQISAALSPGGKGSGPGAQAVKSLLSELEERHLGPLNLVDRASMVRPGAGENTQMSMRAAAATPGEHLGIAREGLLERQVGAQGRLAQLWDRVLGSSDYEGVKAQHIDKLADAGSRAYNTAFASEAPFNLGPVFARWEAQFDKMRGVIPDTMRKRMADMLWTETMADGRRVRIPPQTLESFMYAREGLRDLIGELPKGNNLRRHLTKFYGEMTDEVARTNPAWKVANDIWRDGSAATEALEAGARMSTRLSASSRENLAHFTSAQQQAAKAEEALKKATRAILGPRTSRMPNANELAQATPEQRAAVETAQAMLDAAQAKQELFKHGLARSLDDKLANQGETHDVTKQVLLPGAQKMLRQVLGENGDQVINTLRAEQAMARTYKSQFGSQTTPLREHITEQTWAPRLEVSMLNPLTWVNPALRLAHEHAARTINARRNVDLMRLYTSTDPLEQLNALRAMQGLHQTRSAAGNIIGKPAIGLGAAGLPEALVGEQTAPPALAPYRRP